MAKKRAGSLWECLGRVRDHRKPKGVRFEIRSVLAVAFAAVMAGRKSLAAIARWAEKLEEDGRLLREFGIERDQAPCHVTFHYIFKRLDVKSLEKALAAWVKGLADEGVIGHAEIDGKVLRGSRSGEADPVHLLAAYCEGLAGVVAQVKVPKGGNEITAAVALLKGTPLNGAIVTGDAIFCQKPICREVVDGGGDYFFAVKENQPGLLRDIETAFEEPVSPLRGEKASA